MDNVDFNSCALILKALSEPQRSIARLVAFISVCEPGPCDHWTSVETDQNRRGAVMVLVDLFVFVVLMNELDVCL